MTVTGLGIDLVDVARLEGALRRRPTMEGRVFTERERSDSQRRPERLAARFAAKEATWKALGVGLGATALHDVEVVRAESGEPVLVLRGEAARLAASRGLERLTVSLTHTSTTAAAVVVAEAP
jgi:holo-[acyl-carrier protein] synthase